MGKEPKANPYKPLLDRARSELKDAYRAREALEIKIAKLRQAVTSLGTLCEEDEVLEEFKTWVPKRGNLTQAVCSAITASQVPIGALEIRDALEGIAFKFQSSNSAASVHSVIRRLIQQERIAPCRLTGTNRPGGPKFWYSNDTPPPSPWAFERDVRWKSGVGWIRKEVAGG